MEADPSRASEDRVVLVGKAISHGLRLKIVGHLRRDGEISPNRFAGAYAERLGTVSHHFAALRKAEVISLTRTEARRGAVEHYYVLGGPNVDAFLDAMDVITGRKDARDPADDLEAEPVADD